MTFGTSDLGRGATHDGARVHGCAVLGFAPLLTPVLSPHPPSHRLRSPSPPSVVTQFLSCGAWESESFPVPFQSPRARARPNISCPSETQEGKARTAERMDGEVGRKQSSRPPKLMASQSMMRSPIEEIKARKRRDQPRTAIILICDVR